MSKRRILIVEDNETLLTMIRSTIKILHSKNYDADYAENYDQAASKFESSIKEGGQSFDFIISDFEFPGPGEVGNDGGFAFFSLVQKLAPDMPLYFYSGERNKVIEKVGDAIRVFTKPIPTISDVLEEIEKELSSKRPPNPIINPDGPTR